MDKGLEKINGLTSKMNELEENMTIVSNAHVEKVRELLYLHDEGKKLQQEKSTIDSDILSYEYKQKNIKKWKWQTILKTTVLLLGTVVLIGIGWNVPIFGNIVGHFALVNFGLVMIPVSVSMGESNYYYSVKRYLASHSIEQFEEKLQDYIKQIELNNQKQDSVSEVISKLTNATEEMKNNIEEYRLEIEKIENIRNGVISNYLNNNQELDNLLDSAYEEACKRAKEKGLSIAKQL